MRRKFLTILIFLITVITTAGFAVFTSAANFNKQLNYQAKLTNASNAAVADGSYHMFFRLYDALTGGNAVWFEDRSQQAGDLIPVTNGLFSVLLGSSTPLTSLNFDQTLFLEVQICGTASSTCEILSPRKKLGTVPAAFEADRVDGLSSEQFLRSDAINSTSTASTFFTITQSGAGKIAEFFGPNSTSVLSVLSSGNVGIGTTSPSAMLAVRGGGFFDGGTIIAQTINATSSLTVGGSAVLTSIGSGTNGQLSYWRGTNDLTGIGTTTLTASAPLSLDNPVVKVGGSNSVLTCAAASGSVAGCLSAANWTTFNDKVSSTTLSNANDVWITATTSLPKITTLAGLTTLNSTWTGPLQALSGAISASSTLSEFYGGTGNSTYAAGDLIYASGAVKLSRLAKATDGNILSLVNGLPAWIATTTITTLSNLSITSGQMSDIASYWDNRFSASTTPQLGAASATTTIKGNLNIAGFLYQTGTASSTFTNGINLKAGCFSVGGVCVGGGGGGSGTVGASTAIGQIPYYAAVGTTLTATSTLTVHTNSYVGIGTTTPNWNLQVNGTRPSLALSDYSASANLKHWLFSSMGGDLYIGTSSDAFATSTISALTVNSIGYLGIGTTSPSQQLSVNGSLYVSGGLYNDLTGAGSNFQILQSTGSATKWISTSTLFTAGVGTLPLGTAGQTLTWQTGQNWQATSTLYISADGSVGVGTADLTGAKFKIALGSASVSDSFNDQSKIASIGNNTLSSGKLQLVEAVCGAYTVTGLDGLTYGTVLGEDGKCWLDRNLGATRVAASYSDQWAGYGSYYQWGRSYDGHQATTSSVHIGIDVVTTASAVSAPYTSYFIATTTGNYDWLNQQNNNLWQGVSGTNNPCPTGFRLPTQAEWDAWTIAANIKTCTGAPTDCRQAAYNTNLKLPTAGYRNRSDGALNNQGSNGNYWSSSPNSANAYNLNFNSTGVNPANNNNRANGFSVRCVKDLQLPAK